jgi:glycosyltransferase involved in cell wall biosynthesis
MRILLLTQWYPPEPMKLIEDLSIELRDQGHELTVLTGFPNWPSGKLYPGYRLRFWQREEQNGIRIVRVPLFPDHSRSAFRRTLNFLSFAISATVLGFWLVPRPDVMHVIHPPITIGLPAIALSALWRIRFTLEINDMWPENLRATGMVSNERVLRAIGAFARLVYSRAAFVRVVSPGFRLNLLSKGVPDDKIRVISNWVDTEYYRPVARSPELLDQFGMQGRFNVLYAGTIGLAQGLEVVLDAAARLQTSLPEAQFVLAGDGVELDRLRTEAAARNLANVRFLGRLPGDAMPSLYACADVLMLHLRTDPLFAITIPHKIFTYLAAGKPVLLGGEGDTASLVIESHSGLACPPSNPEALARAVAAFHAMSPEERAALGNNGRQFACQSYSRARLVGEILQMIEMAAPQGLRCA